MSFCLNTDLQMCMLRSLDLIQFSITSLRVEPTSIENHRRCRPLYSRLSCFRLRR